VIEIPNETWHESGDNYNTEGNDMGKEARIKEREQEGRHGQKPQKD
jgi:hypothetical protein